MDVLVLQHIACEPPGAEYLDRVLGPGSLSDLVVALEKHAETIFGQARRMFGGWLDLVAARAVVT